MQGHVGILRLRKWHLHSQRESGIIPDYWGALATHEMITQSILTYRFERHTHETAYNS